MTGDRPGSAQATIAAWRRAGETQDAALAVSCLSTDVEIISPLTARFRFRGPGQAGAMINAAFAVIDEIIYHTEVGDGATRALFYHGWCGDEPFEEAQLLRLDDGLIAELTLFGRPLPAVTAVMAGIGPRMLREQRRPGSARLTAVATAAIALLARQGERRLVPLTDPNRIRSRPRRE